MEAPSFDSFLPAPDNAERAVSELGVIMLLVPALRNPLDSSILGSHALSSVKKCVVLEGPEGQVDAF
jgi:hypothetical protein